MAFLERVFNRLYTICVVSLKVKKYIYNNTQLKYIFFKSNSDTLVVGFQACHKDGARYNYISTIKNYNINRLYIKDDFAENHRGNYYLGCNGRFNVEEATFSLIKNYIKKTGAKKVIFIGSSKGAYAAINFGINFPNSTMIIASPQYYLGKYLNCDYQMPNLIDILGSNFTKSEITALDNRLKNKIRTDVYGKTQTVYIHYSINDHTYKEHIKDMIEDLKKVGVTIHSDIRDYTIHGELKYYYPQYLKESLQQVLE